ncbi:unnamed protein product [Paramecium sonneborni]|uniref:Uncharacterized protein n=1 Tax=Paramecium sonneborni TaxID=65129 RepID=A0A8S1KC71_9CILI|nr:unnamed protein product [Paramecium sonneborni]
MKTKIVSLFLKREHLILVSKMLQITDNANDQEIHIQKIDSKNQKSENRILKTERWPQQDLEYFQNCFLQIANLTFSYFKFHLPANSALQIKEHIKFIHVIKQINFGGVTIEEVFKQQRTRLNLEISKITKSIKLIDEPIMSKLMNTKIDLFQIQTIQDKYFFPKNNDFITPYLILNLKSHIPKTTLRYQNKELQSSITSLEDIPPFQLMNSNLIQPILNYESFKNGYEYKFNKLMQRNSLVQYTIKKYQNKIKQYEIKPEHNRTEDSLNEIKKIFCSQIKQVYENKINQIFIDSNIKFINPTNYESPSLKVTPFQTVKNFESVIMNQIKENQESQEFIPSQNVNEEQTIPKTFDFPQNHDLISLSISQQCLKDSMMMYFQTQKNLQISEDKSSNKLEQRLIKPTLQSLDFKQSELQNQSSSRFHRKIFNLNIQDKNDNSQLNNKFLNIQHQIIEPSTKQLEFQNQKEPPTKQIEFLNQKAILSNRNLQQKSLDRITLKPLVYQTARLKEIRDSNREKKESSFPYIKESLPNIQQGANDFEQEKLKEHESKFSLQGGLQKRIQTNEKEENPVKEILLFQKKNCNLKNQIQNQLILLTRSEQILNTLMSNGQIKGTELYQQLLQPIKIHSSAKFLTPKSNNLISRTKFKKIYQDSNMFSLK